MNASDTKTVTLPYNKVVFSIDQYHSHVYGQSGRTHNQGHGNPVPAF